MATPAIQAGRSSFRARLAELALERLGRAQFTLAVSLHAPDQRLREELIPTAHAYPMEALLDDCRRYVAITGRRVSFEYILLGGLNDQPRHAAAPPPRHRPPPRA